ncbi:MAG: 4Fe-4S binding protein [Lactimicrobium sp.]|uniref:4Fe-4S binding protein n=1 Tax=Lactimicrobium sp. TaxID=2563780 RepID=UPI002F35B284
METGDYLRILTDEIHSTVVATIDGEGHPVTRCIDMMLYDDRGVYFLTAKGKEFFDQLMAQKYISLSAVQGKKCISLSGWVENIGYEKLDEIFAKNTYMQAIYPGDTRSALNVFRIYKAHGNFFDISDPAHIERGTFSLGNETIHPSGYFITDKCNGCDACLSVCPQQCIDLSCIPAVIDPNRCLHCGRCVEVCPQNAIERLGGMRR